MIITYKNGGITGEAIFYDTPIGSEVLDTNKRNYDGKLYYRKIITAKDKALQEKKQAQLFKFMNAKAHKFDFSIA